jgi:hypothetical protein
MAELLQAVASWQALGGVLLLFGFGPGVVLRTVLLIYPKSHPRRRELIGELYACPRWDRPLWVAEQFEVAIFEGLSHRRRQLVRWLFNRRIRASLKRQDSMDAYALDRAMREVAADLEATGAMARQERLKPESE